MAAVTAAGPARALARPCGLPAGQQLWIEFADGSVPFRQALFGRPGLVVATNGIQRSAELRSLGAHTVYWHMSLKGLAGGPPAPAEPEHAVREANALFDRAVAATGCATPVIALNELAGATRATPWPPEVFRYRANVLAVVSTLAERGAHPVLLVPGKPSGRGAPFVAGDAAVWWRELALHASIVRQMHFNAPSIHRRGAVLGSRARRIAMRTAIAPFLALDIPAERLGLLLGFQSGPGKGGREGLQPREAWLEIVKQEALSARQVAGELGLASVWSWGWGTFTENGADPDKAAAACVYLWTRDPSLCDGPGVAGPAFPASLSAGQIALPEGVHCSTSAGRIAAADVAALAGATGDRRVALTALLTRLVLERDGGPVGSADLDRAERWLVDSGYGGDAAAFERDLASRGLDRPLARAIIADQFRRQALAAGLAVARSSRGLETTLRSRLREVRRTTICLRDELPGRTPHTWGASVSPLRLRTATVSIAAAPRTARAARTLTLSGRVTSLRARERVTVYARLRGTARYRPVGSAGVSGDGRWTLRVSHRSQTVYRAVSRSAASRALLVGQRPR
ncbi:MAG: hypothetical protein IT201_03415 [Thermoleophilia bacterium]|nr:hypothetical protein [Thermoleophilia bacterium]